MTSQDAAERLEIEGPNELEKPPRLGFFMLFLLQMTSFIILLLIAAAIASALVTATGSRREELLQYSTPIAIFILVILNAGIAAYTENQAGNALDKLQQMSQPEVTCIRDGKECTVNTTELVRGDIVLLETGAVVPADLRLFDAADVKVDEKALTGEPDDVSKNAKVRPRGQKSEKLLPTNMCFSGCPFVSGKCKAIVWSTGMNTEIGKIAKMMATKEGKDGNESKCGCIPATAENQTPLQENVEKLGARIGVGAIVICIFVYFIGGFLDTTDPEEGGSPWVYMILVSVTLAVAAIPEGIPLCVTISLAMGCTDMAEQNVEVRKLAAVETLGSASVICSDKTGTLTQGKMTMTNMWSLGQAYDISGQGFNPQVGHVSRSGNTRNENHNSDMGVRSTLLSALLCSDTVLFFDEHQHKWDYKGNSSEAPIVVAAQKVGFKGELVATEYARKLTIPFSSARKMMLTVSDVTGKSTLCEGGMPLPGGTTLLAVVKGAPNWVLESCTQQLNPDGTVTSMTPADKQKVNKQVDDYSDMALRVLAVAVNPMASAPFDMSSEDVSMDDKFAACKKDLILVGLVASIDPDRPGVKDSVNTARGAGIRVVMITGDYVKTAIAIAKRVQILQLEDNIDECACDCNKLRPGGDDKYIERHEMDEMTRTVRVFARAKPADKLEIVKSLQRQGFVSAMTGDGVNDAPALNEAMIGVAMGIQGTDVAKGAAEMVLSDDNFVSIVNAVEKGRVIYAGIQKFVAFIMSVHIAEVVQIFVCVVARLPLMRTPLQILFLILVTDLPPSIALGREPGEAGILLVPPRPKTEPIVLNWMWISITINGLILSVVILGIYVFSLNYYTEGKAIQHTQFKELEEGGDEMLMYARTVAFISLVFSENVRAYISRSFDKPMWVGMFGNWYMQIAVVMAIIAMLIAVFLPGFSDKVLMLDGAGIGWPGWGIAAVGPVLTIILCELFKIPTGAWKRSYEKKIRSKPADSDSDTDSSREDTTDSDGL